MSIVFLKSFNDIEIMHEANCIVHDVLDTVEKAIKPGVTTEFLNSVAEKRLSEFDAKSAFRGYKGFPKSICISVNEEVVHGIPSEKRVLKKGDIVSLDFGVYYRGFAGDSARTIILGKSSVPSYVKRFVYNTQMALYDGIHQMLPGNYLSDIGRAIDNVAKKYNYGNVREFCGHGIGKDMHEGPHVFNWVNPNEPDIKLREGMVLALEPMFTLGPRHVNILDDNWTVVTKDNSKSAHWELSVAITDNDPWILGTYSERFFDDRKI